MPNVPAATSSSFAAEPDVSAAVPSVPAATSSSFAAEPDVSAAVPNVPAATSSSFAAAVSLSATAPAPLSAAVPVPPVSALPTQNISAPVRPQETFVVTAAEPPATSVEGPDEDHQELESLRRAIEKQRQIAELKKTLAQLTQENAAAPVLAPAPRAPQADYHGDVKTQRIPCLAINTSVQKRKRWLSDLERAFEAAPYRFGTEASRVRHALDNCDEECREHWDAHLDSMEHGGAAAWKDWDKFVDWTTTLLKDHYTQLQDQAIKLENCHQKETQTPWQFHHFLRALEQEFEAVPESRAAYLFFAKLRPELRDKVSLHATPFPSTRLDMVNTAQRYWDTMQSDKGKSGGRGREDRGESLGKKRGPANEPADAPPYKKTKRGGGGKGKAREEKIPAAETKDSGRQGRKDSNPAGSDGDTLRCYECNSTKHLRNKCPRLRSAAAAPAKSQAVNAGTQSKSQGKA